MAEVNRPSRNRGFYVRMRLLQNKHGRQTDKSYCYRYLKWLLWFSLSCYFFTSYLISHNPQTHKSSTSLAAVSRSKSILANRALFESLNNTVLQQPKTHQGLFKDLKVFVYDLPSKYNSDWLSNERCSNHLFASEVAIHRALLNSDVRTPDPWEADFFFVPIYVSCNFSTINGFPAIGHARSLISSAVQLISSELPLLLPSSSPEERERKKEEEKTKKNHKTKNPPKQRLVLGGYMVVRQERGTEDPDLVTNGKL